MKKLFANLLVAALLLVLLAAGAFPVAAQTPQPANPVVTPAPGSPNEVLLSQIDPNEIQLNGPFDSNSLTFGLPASWRLEAGGKLELNLAVSFNTVAKAAGATAPLVQGGTLSVQLNGVTVGVVSLDTVGEVAYAFDLPADSLISQRADGRMELRFVLDSGISCYVNQQMTVFIHTSSRFSLPHAEVSPDTSLLNFPRPIYQDSVFPEAALVVIPDQPSAAELRAALTVAAGLGNLTGNKLVQDLTTISQLTPEQQAANHIVLVGKAAGLPLLDTLDLPLKATGGQFAFEGGAPDPGVVQMALAPWNKSDVVLVVSGNSEAGVVKAAQALTTGILRVNSAPNLAVVEQVQTTPLAVTAPVDQTLADLTLLDTGRAVTPGKAIKTLRFAGLNSASYRFYLPPGLTTDSSASFKLIFGHSSLLNYSRSGLVILVNGQPIGSVRFSDQTAAVANNEVQFNLPATAVVPGYNRLEIKATLFPVDACTDPRLDGLWATIWPESTLHLPLSPAQVAPLSQVDLSAYPAPFTNEPTLANTAFVLPHDDLQVWRSAMQIASFLGDRSNGALFTLAAFYGDELKDPERSQYNLVVLGQPSKLPLVAELNSSLPAPFDPASDVAIESNLQVKYQIPTSSPVGYVELLPSPWNSNNLVIAGLGNSPQGVAWSASALVNAPLRSQLAGNFAAISGSQVVTTDTRLSPAPSAAAAPAIQVGQPGADQPIDLAAPHSDRPSWILPAIYVALGLIFLVLLVVILGAFRRGRNA